MQHEFDGKKYEKASAHQREWGEKLISELNLIGTEHILDLGCGDGTITAELANLVPKGRVIGIDASHGMIDTAIQKLKPNLRFVLMDINNLNFTNEFDIVFSNAALHWVKNHNLLLKNIMKALKPEGIIRFNFAGDGNCSNFFKVIREAIKLPDFLSYFSEFQMPWFMPTIEEYKSIIEKSSFRNIRIREENADRFFSDKEAMIKWIDQPSLVPFMPYIPEKHKNNFREYVIRRMIEETGQKDGRYFETFRRIDVYAKK